MRTPKPGQWQRRGLDWSESTLYVPGPDWDKSGLEDAPYRIWGTYSRIEVPTLDIRKLFLGRDVTGEGSETTPSRAGARGRRPKYKWDEFYAEIAVRADLDNLPETAAELQRDMAEWCLNTWGEEPSETMLKDKIRLIYRHPRRSAGR